MKKISFTAVFLGLAVNLSSAPLLVEKYQEGQIFFPSTESKILTVLDLTFSTDTACVVLFSVGGFASLAKIWLELDGDSLPPALIARAPGNDGPMPITYSYLITKGNHVVSIKLSNNQATGNYTTCKNAYFQALIFLPDSGGGAVVEQPEPAHATPVTSAVIARGPYVSAPGASEVVDATGRIMKNVLIDGKVQISTLASGTYVARDGERTVVKIVKVD